MRPVDLMLTITGMAPAWSPNRRFLGSRAEIELSKCSFYLHISGKRSPDVSSVTSKPNTWQKQNSSTADVEFTPGRTRVSFRVEAPPAMPSWGPVQVGPRQGLLALDPVKRSRMGSEVCWWCFSFFSSFLCVYWAVSFGLACPAALRLFIDNSCY